MKTVAVLLFAVTLASCTFETQGVSENNVTDSTSTIDTSKADARFMNVDTSKHDTLNINPINLK